MNRNAHIEFLRQQVTTLRVLARRSPQLAEALRRLADQLEAMANELDGRPDKTES